eukprot:COSAG02_NODE_7456_length_3006_cov_1.921913_1_plen_74_part_00
MDEFFRRLRRGLSVILRFDSRQVGRHTQECGQVNLGLRGIQWNGPHGVACLNTQAATAPGRTNSAHAKDEMLP